MPYNHDKAYRMCSKQSFQGSPASASAPRRARQNASSVALRHRRSWPPSVPRLRRDSPFKIAVLSFSRSVTARGSGKDLQHTRNQQRIAHTDTLTSCRITWEQRALTAKRLCGCDQRCSSAPSLIHRCRSPQPWMLLTALMWHRQPLIQTLVLEAHNQASRQHVWGPSQSRKSS